MMYRGSCEVKSEFNTECGVINCVLCKTEPILSERVTFSMWYLVSIRVGEEQVELVHVVQQLTYVHHVLVLLCFYQQVYL